MSNESKVVLITGGAGRIGSEAARMLASRGAKLAVADIAKSKLDKVVRGIASDGGTARYQAENGPWRNFYLTEAKELREGVAKLPTPDTASADTVKAMTPELFFDYLSVRINRTRAR